MSIFGSEYLLEVDVPSDEESEDYAIADTEEEPEVAEEEPETETEEESEDGDSEEEEEVESEDEGDDYTLDEDEGGDEEETDDDSEEPEDIDEEDDSLDGEIKDEEEVLMSDLSDQDKIIRDNELKKLFVDLHNSISNILMKVDRVVKTTDNIKTLNYCENRLGKVQEMLYDYLLDSYKNKSYIQNLSTYYQLIGTLTGIEQLLNSLTNSTDVR